LQPYLSQAGHNAVPPEQCSLDIERIEQLRCGQLESQVLFQAALDESSTKELKLWHLQ
jgi:hypothetical protein